MKKLFVSSVILAAVLLTACAPGMKTVKSQKFEANKFKKIAVMNFSGNNKEAEEAMPEMLVPRLMELGFEVVERSQLKKITDEQKLASSGATEDAIKLGKLAGVSAVIVGNFTSEKKETKRFVTVRRRAPKRIFLNRITTYGKISSEVVFDNISVRLVDVETGDVLLSTVVKDAVSGEDVDGALEEIAESMKKAMDK